MNRLILFVLVVFGAVSRLQAGTPQSNVWRKIGFGHGPGYHAYNGCPPCATTNRLPGGMNHYSGQYVPHQLPLPQVGWFGTGVMAQSTMSAQGYPSATGGARYCVEEGFEEGYEVLQDRAVDAAPAEVVPGIQPTPASTPEPIGTPAPAKSDASKLPASVAPTAPAVKPVPAPIEAPAPQEPSDEQAALDGLDFDGLSDGEVQIDVIDAEDAAAGPALITLP